MRYSWQLKYDMKAKGGSAFHVITFTITVLLAVLGLLLSLSLGSFQLQYANILEIITNPYQNSIEASVIWQLRLPRALMAIVIGGGMALSGYQMQIVFQNPLADPYLLGISAGASLGANAAILGFLPVAFLGIYGISVWAAMGAFLVTILSLALSTQAYKESKTLKLILAGIALSSLAGALNSLLIFYSTEENKLRSIIFWLLGSMDRSTWQLLLLVFIIALVSFVFTLLLSPSIKILTQGEQRANSLGLNTNQLKYTLLVLSSLFSAVAVSAVGIIGFVGLVVPHLSRAFFPVGSKAGTFATFIIGGVLLMWCDIISRWLYAPAGLPIGVISAFLGLPFFLYLLLNKTYRF